MKSAIRLLYEAVSQMESHVENLYHDADHFVDCVASCNEFLAQNPYTMYKCFFTVEDGRESNTIQYAWGEEELRDWWANDSYFKRYPLVRVEEIKSNVP